MDELEIWLLVSDLCVLSLVEMVVSTEGNDGSFREDDECSLFLEVSDKELWRFSLIVRA